MSRIKGDAWAAIFLLAACALFFNDLLATEDSGAYVKTTTLPMALTLALAVLSAALLAWSLWRSVEAPAPTTTDEGANMRVVLLVVLTAAYITVLPWFGFLISTAILIAVASYLYGNRQPVTIIGAMVVIPAGLLLFFEQYMIVLLPSARLFE